MAETRPRGNLDRSLTGVFAIRSPDRLNPVGLHRVPVLEVTEQKLRIAPLEAIGGTPIVDIKPVLAGSEPSAINRRFCSRKLRQTPETPRFAAATSISSWFSVFPQIRIRPAILSLPATNSSPPTPNFIYHYRLNTLRTALLKQLPTDSHKLATQLKFL